MADNSLPPTTTSDIPVTDQIPQMPAADPSQEIPEMPPPTPVEAPTPQPVTPDPPEMTSTAPVPQNAVPDPPAPASSAPVSVPAASPALTPTTPTPDTEIVATNVAVKRGFLPARVYDILKWVALIFLPAAGTMYFGLAGVWGWPNEDKILATITAFDTFLGVLLGISTVNYKRATPDADGDMILDTSHPEKDVLRMALNGAPEDLLSKDKVVFRVVK